MQMTTSLIAGALSTRLCEVICLIVLYIPFISTARVVLGYLSERYFSHSSWTALNVLAFFELRTLLSFTACLPFCLLTYCICYLEIDFWSLFLGWAGFCLNSSDGD